MSVVVVGLNHRTVPLEVLERMTVSEGRLSKALLDLRLRSHLSEAIVLSTCNRTEIYAVAERYHGALDDIRTFLSGLSGLDLPAFNDHLYAYHDDTAVAHLFKVVSGLDSAVLGESEILGQVRHAWERAAEEGATGPALDRLFERAISAGRRARAETAIARGTTSVSQAAVAMATERLGGLADRTVLVLGAGDVGEGMAVALSTVEGVRILVTNRTRTRGQRLAERVRGTVVPFGELGPALIEADLLLTSTGAAEIVVSADDVEHVMAERAGKPLLIVDVAVPRDVDAGAATIPGVTLLDMDDLRSFAEANEQGRRAEVGHVEDILAEEVERYLVSANARQVAPIVASLYERAEALRLAELERFRARLADLEPKEREAVEALTRGIVAKLLHEPTVRLKDAAGTGRGDRLGDAIRSLFDLT